MSINNPELWCKDNQHKAEVDIVTYILHPDEVTRALVLGTVEEIAQTIHDMEEKKAPSASLYVTYCCDNCKKGVTNDNI
jgi:hypothetical protein